MTTSFEAILNTELATEAKAAKKSVNKLSKKAIHRAEERARGIFDAQNEEKVNEKPEPKETKRSVCAEVFRSMIGARRKNVIASMMDLAGLSKAGASTYYQNFFSGKWEV